MLSKRFYRLINRSLKVYKCFYVSPLQYDATTSNFSCDSGTKFQAKLYRNIFIAYFWASASACQIIYRYKQNDLNSMNLGLAFLMGALRFILAFTILLVLAQEHCRLSNGLLSFFRHLHENYMPHFAPDNSRLNLIHDTLQLYMGGSMIILCAMLILFMCLDPLGVIFVGAFIPCGIILTPIKMILLLIHAYLVVVFGIAGVLILSCCILNGFYLVAFYTKELRLGQVNYLSDSMLRTKSSNIQQVFRAFQILHNNFLDVFGGPVLLVSNAGFMVSSIYLNFVLIRYWSNLELYTKAPLLAGNFVVLSIWTSFMYFGKILFIKGNKVINSWKISKWETSSETKVMHRFAKSCKPLVVAYGTQFVLRKASLLVFYRGVSRGTVRALLSTK